jgi:hypothetical protein
VHARVVWLISSQFDLACNFFCNFHDSREIELWKIRRRKLASVIGKPVAPFRVIENRSEPWIKLEPARIGFLAITFFVVSFFFRLFFSQKKKKKKKKKQPGKRNVVCLARVQKKIDEDKLENGGTRTYPQGGSVYSRSHFRRRHLRYAIFGFSFGPLFFFLTLFFSFFFFFFFSTRTSQAWLSQRHRRKGGCKNSSQGPAKVGAKAVQKDGARDCSHEVAATSACVVASRRLRNL